MNGKSIFRRGVVLVLAVLMAFVLMAPAGAAGLGGDPTPMPKNPGVIPPQAKYMGHTYGEWSNMWWQWAFSNPITAGNEELNPLYDTTGVNCGAGQSGHVWNLAGIFTITEAASGAKPADSPVVRTDCVVPAGTALFVPILNTECDVAQYPAMTEAELRACVADSMAAVGDLSLVIDGREVNNIRDYVIGPGNATSPLTLPNNNLYQYWGYSIPAGTYDTMVSDGYYVMLAPLSKGEHSIEIYGTAPAWNFVLDVHYDPLTVR